MFSIHIFIAQKYLFGFFWRKKWHPNPVYSPGEISWTGEPGQVQSWGCKESDMTERLTHKHTHTYTSESSLFLFSLFPLSIVKVAYICTTL